MVVLALLAALGGGLALHQGWLRLPPDWAHYLANVDYRRRLALVAVDPATESLVAVARHEPTAAADIVEVAFVVQDAWQNRGLGTRLFGALLAAANRNGFTRFRASVLADNRRMLDMIARFASVTARRLEHGIVELEFTTRALTTSSTAPGRIRS